MTQDGAPLWLSAAAACVGALMASVFGFIIVSALQAALGGDAAALMAFLKLR